MSDEAAAYLGVSAASLRKWSNQGLVPVYRTPGGQRRFSTGDLDEFMRSMRQPSVDGVAALPAPPARSAPEWQNVLAGGCSGSNWSPWWRPSRSPIWANRDSNWDLPLFAVLLASSVVGDLTALDAPIPLGQDLEQLPGDLRGHRPARRDPGGGDRRDDDRGRLAPLALFAPPFLLINLVAYAWFPLVSGIAFNATLRATGHHPGRRALLPARSSPSSRSPC